MGNPNVGKSALFGALTGTYVTVSNYPGTTVEITTGHAVVGGAKTLVRDTPGANSFIPFSEDERVTRDILLEESAARTVLAVGDAKNLERTISLALQVCEMEVPAVLCLNMMDEASARGIRIDLAALGERMGLRVVGTVATRREGIDRLSRALGSAEPGRAAVVYPSAIESALRALVGRIPDCGISRRSLGLMVLAGDETLVSWIRSRCSGEDLAAFEEIRQRVRREFREPIAYVIGEARLRAAGRIADSVSSRPPARRGRGAAAGIADRLATHPFWGVPVLAGVLWAVYLFVGVLGAGTLVDLMEDGLFRQWINPWATVLAERIVPWSWLKDFFVGPYGLVTMALTYALALILPIVGTFFIAFGVLEDSGYLPRLAVMVNRIFRTMGLNGKAVLPMVLGLGCDTMATMTTRILETRKERLIVILLLALGVPCSAQLTVVMALLSSLSGVATLIWLGVVVGVLFMVGALAARILPGSGSDFVLELPPLRLPRLGNIVVKTLARIEWYLREAVPLFVLGTVVLFVGDRFRVLGLLERAAEPVLTGLLGLPGETAPAFVIGFLRRDFGAAGLYQLNEAGRLDPVQILVAVSTMTLFIPCVANFFMIVKERGWKTGIAVASFVFPFAVGVGAFLNWALRTLGWTLQS